MILTGYARNTTSAVLFLSSQPTVIEWVQLDDEHIQFNYNSEIDAPSHIDVDFHASSPSELDETVFQRERERVESLPNPSLEWIFFTTTNGTKIYLRRYNIVAFAFPEACTSQIICAGGLAFDTTLTASQLSEILPDIFPEVAP